MFFDTSVICEIRLDTYIINLKTVSNFKPIRHKQVTHITQLHIYNTAVSSLKVITVDCWYNIRVQQLIYYLTIYAYGRQSALCGAALVVSRSVPWTQLWRNIACAPPLSHLNSNENKCLFIIVILNYVIYSIISYDPW